VVTVGPVMREETDPARDLGSLVVPAAGALVETGDLWEPYYLGGPGGGRVVPVSEFLRDLQATGRPATTQRSYALALLRWFRFVWAVDVPWDQATRVEARDFCRYLQLAGKPGGHPAAARTAPGRRPSPGRFAPSTVAHCETVCRDTEWEEFLGHFERRRVALGDCGRAYATSCIHEHSCFSDLTVSLLFVCFLAGCGVLALT